MRRCVDALQPQCVDASMRGPWPWHRVAPSFVALTLTFCPIVQAQVQEMQMIREKVYQMEQAQMGLKQK